MKQGSTPVVRDDPRHLGDAGSPLRNRESPAEGAGPLAALDRAAQVDSVIDALASPLGEQTPVHERAIAVVADADHLGYGPVDRPGETAPRQGSSLATVTLGSRAMVREKDLRSRCYSGDPRIRAQQVHIVKVRDAGLVATENAGYPRHHPEIESGHVLM